MYSTQSRPNQGAQVRIVVRRVMLAIVLVACVLLQGADLYFDDYPEEFRELTGQHTWQWPGSLSNFWAWVICAGPPLLVVLILEVRNFRRRRRLLD